MNPLCGGHVFQTQAIMLFWHLLLRTTGTEFLPSINQDGEIHVIGLFDPEREKKLCLPKRWNRTRWDPSVWAAAFNLKDEWDMQHRPSLTLSSILSMFRCTEASNPPDMVYAFLSLLEESEPGNGTLVKPHINYAKSTVAIFVEWTRYILQREQNLVFLGLVETTPGASRLDGLPSWTPDLTNQGHKRPMVYNQPGGQFFPFTVGSAVGDVHIEFVADEVLELRGSKLGTVMAVSAATSWQNNVVLDIADFLLDLPEYTWVQNPRLNSALRQYLSSSPLGSVSDEEYRLSIDNTVSNGDSGTFQSRIEVYWRTISFDCYKTVHPAPSSCESLVTCLIQSYLARSLLSSLMRPDEESLLKDFLFQLDQWVRLHKPGELDSAEAFETTLFPDLVSNMPDLEDTMLESLEKSESFQNADEAEKYLESTWASPACRWLTYRMVGGGFFKRIDEYSEGVYEDSDLDDLKERDLPEDDSMMVEIEDDQDDHSIEKSSPGNTKSNQLSFSHDKQSNGSNSPITRAAMHIAARPDFHDFFSIPYGRTLVRLDSGLLGLAALPTQPGDEVWALAGSQVPFILRTNASDGPSGARRYRVIGETYVHGIMHGEEVEGGGKMQGDIIQIV
ncbi:hypothetical protein N0V82_003025 [Gnomoniopsis sp. IMI 355080]|nr:hypothetical protein N0V82_003025 [Gnomoniopsis sp. IMI 355080]